CFSLLFFLSLLPPYPQRSHIPQEIQFTLFDVKDKILQNMAGKFSRRDFFRAVSSKPVTIVALFCENVAHRKRRRQSHLREKEDKDKKTVA
ncbi:hypothetical protein, partial [Bacillus cereus group sp. Bce036]|uniref:hypothetical protein n=1 Tax=Bacillus cereus group sp. Bce036 TaxID=3445233 RepID=UPI003F6A3A65